MMNIEEKKVWMKRYAELLVKFGVNIQRGQKLVFALPHEAREFGLHVVEAAYEAGSGHVFMYYFDHEIFHIQQQKAQIEVLKEGDNTIEKALGRLIDEGAAVLFLVGAHPEAMPADTTDQRKNAFLKTFMNSFSEIQNRRRSQITNSCLPFFPTLEYSAYLFPDLEPSDAQLRLMEMLTPIFKLDKENPVAVWHEHISKLKTRANLLNSYAFDSLHFSGGETDLMIGLVKDHIWCSAFGTTENGVDCAFNFPSEELFTAPDWRRAEGSISSTRETFTLGFMIDKVRFDVQKGKIIKEETDGDLALLKKLLNQDAQSRYLGEVALVSEDSPIASQPMSFKNLLFDENAGSHIAFGSAYPHCIHSGASMTKEELLNAGMNVSEQHIDLIIGSRELLVTGITAEGKEVEIMTNGLWAGEFR
ncbi:MAG TPA: hypothetical protein DCO79_03490 [Spirochaeta sp.]|nr:hypothetical protein [Spirochaeta sp.]